MSFIESLPFSLSLRDPKLTSSLFVPSSFFTLLNPASCQLDSRVHTPDFVQQTSPVLFTAVLCVAAKVERPDLYPPLLIHANSLVAKGFAEDLVTVEFVSSISLLSFWKPSHVSPRSRVNERGEGRGGGREKGREGRKSKGGEEGRRETEENETPE